MILKRKTKFAFIIIIVAWIYFFAKGGIYIYVGFVFTILMLALGLK
jgi:hypothetical protein